MEQVGYQREELSYRVSIHESADVEGANRWWEEQAGSPVEVGDSRDPQTTRDHARSASTADELASRRAGSRRAAYNTGDNYHGCPVIAVPRASALYWRIEGIMMGLVADCSCDPVRG